MTQIQRQLIETKDGSHSLYQENIDEHYHSIHGAVTESKHIFIGAGLDYLSKHINALKIFEVGFGTGLNATLSALYATEKNIDISYHTVEYYPLQTDILESLNYGNGDENFESTYHQIHQADWNKEVVINEHFNIFKIEEDLISMKLNETYDLIYFDAFAPEKQVEMWSENVFKKIYKSMNEGGVLVTYCVKGEIRRRLNAIGFRCEKIPGPVGGKREMLRAKKP